jgi:hypothetical protein
LEPINIFFYTWRFIETLEREEENAKAKMFYHWISLGSILLFPLAYYGIFASFVIEYSKTEVLLYELKTNVADHYYHVQSELMVTLGYISLVSNLFSCLIMALTVRLLNKMTKCVKYAREAVDRERKIN